MTEISDAEIIRAFDTLAKRAGYDKVEFIKEICKIFTRSNKQLSNSNFKESDHPRDKDGKFTDKGEGSDEDFLNKDPRKMSFKEFFGTEHKGVKGQDAINLLLEKQEGYVKSAFHRDDIGGIDLVWGNNLAGLCHIIKRREETNINSTEFLSNIADVIENGSLTVSNGKFYIWKDKKKVVLSIDFNGENVRFIITAFMQRKE